jgi:hypothetical protein
MAQPIIQAKKNIITGKVEAEVKQKALPMPLCPHCGHYLKSVENRTYGEETVIVACGHCLAVLGTFYKKKSLF